MDFDKKKIYRILISFLMLYLAVAVIKDKWAIKVAISSLIP